MAENHFNKYRKELDAINLKTIDDLENLVKPLIKDATKIILKRQEKMPENTQLKSQFGGQPYFEKGEHWPMAKNGEKLEFVFQIFNEEGLIIPEKIKLIQFYYDFDSDELIWDTEDDGWLVKIYENIDKDNCVIIEKPEELDTVKYFDIEYEKVKSLPDWEGISTFCDNASKLSCVLNEDAPWVNYDNTVEKLIGEQNMYSQLGGYAQWIQGGRAHKDFVFLFQIDSEEDAGLYWSDVGMIYVFYNCKTKEIKFELQSC